MKWHFFGIFFREETSELPSSDNWRLKMLLVVILFLLKVLSCVSSKDITVIGYEGGKAVIDCPYQKDDVSYPKYLQSSESGNVVIRSFARREWTHRGRVSLQDKKNRYVFTVTINRLTLKDAGKYWCGADSWLFDNYITVNLKVVQVMSPEPIPVVPKATTRSKTTFDNSTSVTTRITTSRQPSEVTETESSPTSPTSGALVYVGAGLAVVMFVLILSLFIFYTQKTRGSKSLAPPSGSRPNASSRNTQQVQCDYAEVTISPGHSASASSCATASADASAIYANVQQPSNQNPDSVDYTPICFVRDKESLQYATVRFTDPPAGGDKQRSTQRHERDGAVIYSTVNGGV